MVCHQREAAGGLQYGSIKNLACHSINFYFKLRKKKYKKAYSVSKVLLVPFYQSVKLRLVPILPIDFQNEKIRNETLWVNTVVENYTGDTE